MNSIIRVLVSYEIVLNSQKLVEPGMDFEINKIEYNQSSIKNILMEYYKVQYPNEVFEIKITGIQKLFSNLIFG